MAEQTCETCRGCEPMQSRYSCIVNGHADYKQKGDADEAETQSAPMPETREFHLGLTVPGHWDEVTVDRYLGDVHRLAQCREGLRIRRLPACARVTELPPAPGLVPGGEWHDLLECTAHAIRRANPHWAGALDRLAAALRTMAGLEESDD